MWLALTLVVTAYAPAAGAINCNADCSVTAAGVRPVVGVAACPREWPFGTRLVVPGYGRAVCLDHGGAIAGQRIDVVMETREEALAWGRRRITVFVRKERRQWTIAPRHQRNAQHWQRGFWRRAIP